MRNGRIHAKLYCRSDAAYSELAMPLRSAYLVSSAMLCRSSLFIRLARWASTVLTVTCMILAICAIGTALGNHLQHLPLAGELVVSVFGRCRLPPVFVHRMPGDGRAEE